MSVMLPKPEPSLVTLPDVTVAVVHASGEAAELGPRVMKALYGAVYRLESEAADRALETEMGMPRSRWDWRPGASESAFLEGAWALPVPDGTRAEDLISVEPGLDVGVERWTYGECAWILHVGAYDEERPAIDRLSAFIRESGREIAGMFEEWYLSGPDEHTTRTVILYPVRPVR